ncbi:MAG: nitroreductase [Actinobacteria bacterium]|uniref:Unannotated protein n=1 Tax=freshwater metagenome TaxID=449393 RepID=A0A6J7IPJ9_9ZZZZ|nr:nitroreductase [Actinomycetota bacterium]MSW77525.1 nitroreductase [Actinomycetota bacterium]MSX92458.1 nitroreductase [Actinomycetota bacterium]MSZ82551.1 nitroreductase [Actinomycetota bacterium]MTB17765.1 nitroreductase [Actinomycetota bacterium]
MSDTDDTTLEASRPPRRPPDLDTDFFAVAGRQRACRSYTNEDVSDETLRKLLHIATRAPSAQNVQPWRFVVVREAHNREAIGRLMKQIWEAGARTIAADECEPEVFRDVDRGLGDGELAAAPVLVVVGGDSRVVHRTQIQASVITAVQNVLLGATALGLGSCLTTLATFRADEMRALVGFPPEIDPVAVIPVGHPRRLLTPPQRASLSEKVFGERYGEPWPG